jgi:GR25 family glycosyltransferase involved in LPS biosynthesis
MSQRLDVIAAKYDSVQRAAASRTADGQGGASLLPQDMAKVRVAQYLVSFVVVRRWLTCVAVIFSSQIDEVYQALLKSESLHTDLPVVVDRLVQLKTIHEEMAFVVNEFKTLDTEQSQIASMLRSNETLLQQLEANFASNMAKIQDNFKVLEEKMASQSK